MNGRLKGHHRPHPPPNTHKLRASARPKGPLGKGGLRHVANEFEHRGVKEKIAFRRVHVMLCNSLTLKNTANSFSWQKGLLYLSTYSIDI